MVKFFILFFCYIGTVSANTTICKIEENSSGIKALAWDDQGAAKITDKFNVDHSASVIFKRKHNNGYKVNIFVKYEKNNYGSDASEFIVFPIPDGGYRVVGVSYIYSGSKQYLNSSEGNYSATCITL